MKKNKRCGSNKAVSYQIYQDNNFLRDMHVYLGIQFPIHSAKKDTMSNNKTRLNYLEN